MKKKFTLFVLAFLLVLANSCKNEKSLQAYLVETSGKEGFYTGDIPVSSVLSTKANVSDDVKETLKSIKKVNVAFLPKTEDNSANYETEKVKLKAIFSDNDDYKSLMTMKFKDMNVNVFYTGNTDAIDEVIIFGYGNKNGVGVARLLGENMNPAMIVKMMNSVKMDAKNLKGISAIFKGQ